MIELYASAGITLTWRPEVPCLVWHNSAPTSSEEFAAAFQAFWRYIREYVSSYPHMGVIFDVTHAGQRSQAEVDAAARLGEKNAQETGLRKLAFVFSDADGPIQAIAALQGHIDGSVVQVRLFGTQTLAERWLREKG